MKHLFFLQNPLSLVVGSRSARSWLVNGSFTAGKFLATLLLLLTLGVGNARGTTSVTGTYKLVTSTTGIAAGDTVLLVNKAGAKALTGISTTSKKYGTLADVTVSSDIITLSSADVEELKVEAGNTSGSFSFKGTGDVSGYLNYSGSDNTLSTNATKSNNTSWTLNSYAAANGMTIANKNTTTRIIRFNSDRFACYTNSTGTLVNLYKKVYAVKYNNNGGTGTMTDASSPYNRGSNVTVKSNTFTAPDGKTFNGWNTKANGTGTSYAAGATISSIQTEITLYAQWTSAAPAYTITAASSDNNHGTVSLDGSIITATPAHCYEYASTAYTVSPSGKATVTQGTGENINKFTVSDVEADVTVTINFAAKASGRTVNFDAGPGVCATTSLDEDCLGDGITLPNVTATGVCKGWTTFAGWATAAVTDSTTTSGVTLYADGSKFVPTSNNQTLYAVYSKSKGGAAPTAYSAGDTGDFVLAAYNTNDSKWYALPTTPSLSSGKIAGSVITVSTTSNSVNYVTSANASGYTWTIANATNGQTITDGTKTNNNPNYIYHSNGGSSGTNLDYGTSTSYTWKIESETNGLTFKAMSGSTTNSRGMLVSGTQFGGYSLSNEDNSGYYRIQVLPIADASTTYYCSDPNCCLPLGTINGSVSWTSGEATVSFNDLNDVSNWGLKYKKTSDSDVPASWSTYNGNFSSANSTRSNSTAISGLDAGVSYDFKVTGTYNGSSYCTGAFEVPLYPSSSSYVPQMGNPSASTITGLGYKVGASESAAKSFTITVSHLTGNLTVEAPNANFEVSSTSATTGFGSSATLTQADGTKTVWVRLATGLEVNTYGGNSTYVTITGGGAAGKQVSVSGVVSPDCSDPTIDSDPEGATYNLNATATDLEVEATNVGTGPALSYQWYSNTANSTTTPTPTALANCTTSTYKPSTATAGTKYYFCVVSSGACSTTSGIAAVTVNTPIISVGDNKTSVAFGDKAYGSTNIETIIISGSNLANAENIGLAIEGTGASAFALSVNGNPVSELEASNGSVAETTITITYTAAAGLSEATLTISSTGATSKTIALSGTGKYQATFYTINSPQSILADNEGKLVLPSDPEESCNGSYSTFIGWYSTAAGSNGDPTANIASCGTKAVTTHVLESNETYYAVWGNGALSADDVKQVTLDFTSNTVWGFPESTDDAAANEEISYTKGDYTVKIKGDGTNKYYFNSTNNQLLLGKTSGVYLKLPAFDFAVSKIVATEPTGSVSGKITWNVYSGENSVSEELTGCSGGGIFVIDENYREIGTIYQIQLTNANNLQFKTLEIYSPGAGATGFISSCCSTWDADPVVTYAAPADWTVGDAAVNVSISGTTHGTASYVSSNPSVISVAANGDITPLAIGSATITVTWTGDGYCDKAVTTDPITVHGFVDVTFKKNGGTGTDDQTQSVEVGVSTALTSLATLGYGAPDCKEFGGWATTSDGEAVYDDEDPITASEATTLWAVWNTKTLSVAQGTGTAVGCEGGAFTYASSVACGGDVTITSSPDATHKAPFTITVLPYNAYEEIDGNVIKNVTKPITSISVSYTEKTSYAITWNVNGVAYAPHQEEEDGKVNGDELVYEGNTITTLPTAPADITLTCKNKFMGWSKKHSDAVPQTASFYDDLFTTAAGAPEIEAATDFYAVFATASGESSWTELINEEFDNTQTSDDATAIESSTFANFSGATEKAYKGSGGIKLGASSSVGYVTTKELDLSKDFKVSLKAKAYGTDASTLYVKVGSETQSVSTSSTDPLTNEFKTFVFEFDATEEETIEIGTSVSNKGRAYIDDVVISKKAATISDYVTECAAVEAPTFSPAEGEYSEAQTVTIASATDGAKVYYTKTTDGSTPADPTAESTEATSSITVDQNTKIKAIAIKDEVASAIVPATYTLKVATPTISGTTSFLATSEVTITAGDGTSIYYTTNGDEPTTESTPYSAPFEVNATTTVKAIAAKTNWTSSEIASQAFTKITPMTVATALTNINALANNGTIADQYVKGLISEIVQLNGDNTITYYISDDGTTSSQLQVYKGSAGVVKAAFTSVDDLKVGEEVVVFGTLKKYKSGSNPVIPEFVNPNEIVAYRPYSPMAWSANAYTAELGGSSNVFPSLSGTAGLTISYSSSDPTKASFADASVYDITLNAVTGGAPVVITATSAANASYVATSKSYSLTVEAAVTRYSLSYVKNGGTSDATDSEGETETNLPDPLPTITKAGYNFGGWYLESTFDNLANAGDELTENTTLYAQWLEPYTVAEALTMIAALGNNESTANVYVAGVVTDDEIEISSSSATYYIKDAGEDNSLMVYKGKGLNNADVSEGDIQEDDQVVVYGPLKKYVKNTTTTPEIVNPNQLYSKVRPTVDVTGVTLPSTANVRAGKTVTLTPTFEPANATNKNVTWSVTSGDDYAEVDENGAVTGKAEGTAVIQVETADGGFTATCTVTVAAGLPTFTEDDHEWIKVTNASKLVAGRFYVIAESANGKTATTSISSSVMGHVGTTFSSDKSTIAAGALGANTAIFELGGNSTDGWTLYEISDEENTGYLSSLSSSAFSWSEEVATNSIAIDENGKAILGNASGYRLLYNSSSPRFKTYNSSTSASMLLPQLYMWAELSHSVTFDANGGVAESVPGVERTDEGKITIPSTEPTHSDVAKAFAGWYKSDAPGTLYNAGDEFSTNVDVTLYAKWNTVPTYTVTYVPGGTGTGIPAVASYPAGRKVLVATIEDLSNPGFLFTGWVVKDAELNELAIDENNEFTMPASNVTITAGWERQSSQKWALVKSADDLEIDAEYVIACTSKSKALGSINTSGTTHYGNPVDVVIDGEILRGSSAMVTFTLVEGKDGENYAFQNGSNYLTCTANKSLDITSTTPLSNNSSWTISIDANYDATITNLGVTDSKLQYNSSSPRFACYTSSQTKIQLYKKVLSATITASDATEANVPDNADVTVKDGGVLTISSNDKTIGDLNIEAGGKVTLTSNKLTVVGTFTIETTMASGKSGQLNGATASNFAANGDAYIDITLGAGGTAEKWHAFTVPFPVDAINGIYDLDGNPLTNEVNYAIMEYLGEVRATGKYGWKKYRGVLVPGTFYLMTVDGERTTYRFKKTADGALVAGNTKPLYEYASSTGNNDNGWNGVGNPTLRYGKVNLPVQVLDPTSYTYETFDINETNFVVGTPFFIQATEDGTMTFGAASGTANYAPKRTPAKSIESIKVRFGNEEYMDKLYVSASEDALNQYETGKDLVKMTMTNTPSVAQIFGMAYNTKLCMVNTPLVNNKAEVALELYAPADGEYTISAEEREDATVYLLYEGRIIWNLSAGAYTSDFVKGNNTGYGIRVVKAPKVTTGIENEPTSDSLKGRVSKVVIDNNVFILRNGQMFDVTGKMAK